MIPIPAQGACMPLPREGGKVNTANPVKLENRRFAQLCHITPMPYKIYKGQKWYSFQTVQKDRKHGTLSPIPV